MKYLHYIFLLPLFLLLLACSGTDSKTGAGHPVEDQAKNQSAGITHEDGWTIVSRIENADRVYWFLAPEVDNVSPAMFKKIIYTGSKSELDSRTVSQCDAPKQICGDLMKKFKKLSEKYK